MEAAQPISVVSLFLNADIVVKGVLLLLLAASVWSWAVIIDKLWRLGAISRAAREHEARAAGASTAEELWAGPRMAQDPAAKVIAAGLQESAAGAPPDGETTDVRRARIDHEKLFTQHSEMR